MAIKVRGPIAQMYLENVSSNKGESIMMTQQPTFTTKKAAQVARNQMCALLNLPPTHVRVVPVHMTPAGLPARTLWTVLKEETA